MKILQSILIFLTCTINSHGQTDTNSYAQITVGRIAVEITKQKKPNKISTKVEITSAFPSGDSAWVMSFQNKLNQTIPFRNGAKEGKYIASVIFIVTKDGRISDVKCVTDPGFGMGERVVRAFKGGSKWTPVPANGRTVSGPRN